LAKEQDLFEQFSRFKLFNEAKNCINSSNESDLLNEKLESSFFSTTDRLRFMNLIKNDIKKADLVLLLNSYAQDTSIQIGNYISTGTANNRTVYSNGSGYFYLNISFKKSKLSSSLNNISFF